MSAASAAIAEVEDTKNLFRQNASQPSGRLRIDVPGRIGRLVIAPALPDFLDRYPHIELGLGVRTWWRTASTACCGAVP